MQHALLYKYTIESCSRENQREIILSFYDTSDDDIKFYTLIYSLAKPTTFDC
jgi:hypothetical protein